MNESKDLPKKLPEMELTFLLNAQGNVTSKQYEGEFKFRMPTAKQRARADILRSEYNGGVKSELLAPDIAQFHDMISYLRITLVEVPDWWKKSEFGYDLYDANIVEAVYSRCMMFEAKWIQQVWGTEPEKVEVADEQGE